MAILCTSASMCNMFNYIYWNPDAVALSIGSFSFRWYGLCWALALMSGYVVMNWLYRDQKIGKEKFEPLFLHIFLGVLIGARLGHCLFYEPAYWLTHPIEMILPIKRDISGSWHLVGYEGLASHGGVLGMMAAIWLYCRRYKVNIMRVFDNMGVVAPLSAALIRIGNLFNSEIVGNPTNMPWGFIFARNGDDFARHPAQLYEAMFYLLLFLVTIYIYRHAKNSVVGNGKMFGLCLTCIFVFRFFIEFLKENQEAYESQMFLNMGQLLSVPLIIVGAYCLCGGRLCRKLGEK